MSPTRWRRLAGRPIWLSVLVGVTVAMVTGGWVGLLGGAAAAVASYRWLARHPSGDRSAEQRRIRADLPFAADLLAAALRAGSPPDVAAACVAHAVSGPLSDRLGRVARALRLGAPAAEAWGYLGDTEGAQRMARAAVRSQHSGAALAGSLARVAEDLRSDLLVAADAQARRAGVLIVLPLGLCFLPAFVLAGLVPVLVAILGDVLSR
jgi:pilus assembly protein TadC